MDKEDQKSGGEPKNPMNAEAAARIQSSHAKQHDGKVDKGSFPARAQAAAAKNENMSKKRRKRTVWWRFQQSHDCRSCGSYPEFLSKTTWR